jgi:hypothetical protein
LECSGKTQLWIGEWVSTDLDRDGHNDSVAVVNCDEAAEAPGRQIVGFRINGGPDNMADHTAAGRHRGIDRGARN